MVVILSVQQVSTINYFIHGIYSFTIGCETESHQPQSFLPYSCGCGKCKIIDWETSMTPCKYNRYDKFPKLLVVDPKHPEADKFKQDFDKHASLHAESTKLTDKFQSLVKKTWEHMYKKIDSKEIDVTKVIRAARSNLAISLPQFNQLEELQNHFHELRVSWYSFHPLYSLVEEFLPEIGEDWETYLAAFHEYCNSRSLKDCVNVFFDVKEQQVFLLEIDNSFRQFTFADIEAMKKSLSLAIGIPSVCLHLVTVRAGSLIIYFHYCYSNYLMIFKSLTTHQLKKIYDIKAYRILSLVDLHKQFRYDNIQCYSDESEVSKYIL